MKKCAFLSMDNLDNFECYDLLLIEPFQSIGWQVTEVPWRATDTNWSEFDVVIIRSPWDYQDDPETFMQCLEKIDAADTHLENPLDLVKWNIDKNYLKDLEEKTIPIVPSLFGNTLSNDTIQAIVTKFQDDEIVIKPTISANADDTYRLYPEEKEFEKLASVFFDKPFLVQPFMKNIVTEGEFSLFFFGSQYSHTILKTPKDNDFRVQEEHGGTLLLIEPEPPLLEVASRTMACLTPTPLYGRVDFVRGVDGFYLMELELIEPSLYFNMDEEAPVRFATVFGQWTQKLNL